ncbi:EAL domain-containing protein [Elusimicrobiota bacterium]
MKSLVLQILDPSRLERVHGDRTMRVVQEDIRKSFWSIANMLLQHHRVLKSFSFPRFGTWLVNFATGDREILTDSQEQEESLLEAGKRMTRKMLEEELGTGVAARIEFRLGILGEEVASDDLDRIYEVAWPSICALPATNQSPPEITRDALLEIIREKRLSIHLQPIVSLRTAAVVGFEALVRGPEGSSVQFPGPLFRAASYHGLEDELDLGCAAAALEWEQRIPDPLWLSFNVGSELAATPKLRQLLEDPQRAGALRGKVMEVTEIMPIASPSALRRALDAFRTRGLRVALDDTGCGFFNMKMVRSLQPDIVKLCITVVRRLEKSPAIVEACRELVREVGKRGAVALGEGVERPEQGEILKACGVELAQGFLYAKPRPAAEVLANLPDQSIQRMRARGP